MRITTKLTISMLTGEVLEHEHFEYSGPLDLCDRSAQAGSKSNAANAGELAGKTGGAADTEHASLQPFYQNEMNADHLFDPAQTGELLTAAQAGSGGALGSFKGEAELQAARTRNPSAFTKSQQEMARDKMKADAGASEGIAAQDILGAKQLNQQGAAGMQGLYGADMSGQLNAMGQQQQDIMGGVQAGQSGWLQNMNATIKTLGDANPFKPKVVCWIAAATYGGWDHPRVDIVRQFIFNDWPKRSLVGKVVAKLYMKLGERVAEHVKVSPVLKSLFRNLFDRIN